MPYKFEIYKDKANEFRVRFRAPNGEKMFATEGYSSKASAKGVIKSIIKNTPKAAIDDQTLVAKAAPAKSSKKAKAKSAKPARKKAKRKAAKPKAAAAAPAPMADMPT
jgi:uncharacterized protein YegP (UPF0339 family)